MNNLLTNSDENILVGGSLSHVEMCGDEIIKCYKGGHPRGYEKLRREVAYITALPDALKGYYPKVVNVVDSPGYYEYRMPYYKSMVSLSDQIFSNCSIYTAWEQLAQITDFMDTHHYPQMASKDGVDTYINKIIHTRLLQAHDALKEIPEVKKIIDGSSKVNGTKLMSLNDIRSALITDDFTNRELCPTELNLIHGNFHLDNILVDDDSFVLIDPRGELFGSKMYDVCKMFVHMLIRYDEIHVDKFKVKYAGDNIEVLFTDQVIGERYGYIQRQYLKKCIDTYGSEFFTKSLLVLGGAHAVSFASYHARKDNPSIDRVQAYLSAGMLLLTTYLSSQEIDMSRSLFTYEPNRVRL